MAANTANNLQQNYSRLSTSVERLSSGLRINSASDDAAGLAIRELMRADIAATRQGVRNANDAISLIQVADGALGVIDEKLIRMKELAEQAATGTYDSTQRLMIDSEFQAMGAEIDRIARATDFNGIKLLDGKGDTFLPEGIELDNPATVTVQDYRILDSQHRYSFNPDISDLEIAYKYIDSTLETVTQNYTYEYYTDDGKLYKKTTIDTETVKNEEQKVIELVHLGFNYEKEPNNPDAFMTVSRVENTNIIDYIISNVGDNHYWSIGEEDRKKIIKCEYSYENYPEDIADWAVGKNHKYMIYFDFTGNGRADFIGEIYYGNYRDPDDVAENTSLDLIGSFVRENVQSTILDISKDEKVIIEEVPLQSQGNVKIHFGPMNDSAEDYYYIEKRDCTLKGLGLDGVRVETQDNAQNALVTINDAIVRKDQARAYYGAKQNRLENTITNLTIQSENLQTSESRISDVDVSQEMTQFVRNQVITQSAVAMLGQANSFPHMLMTLLQG